MLNAAFDIHYNKYADAADLSQVDQQVIGQARKLTSNAYAPYSGFKVASVAQTSDNNFVHGTNQENASYPIGLCAERVMLAAISSVAPATVIKTICISYNSEKHPTNLPIAPCGICRQSLVEFESRFNDPIRLLLTGQSGEVFEFKSVSDLLPMAFKKQHLVK
ncbi:MAG: cytidine deaminase [Chitinophagaceae bacterium]